jgi:hypothetical protein
MLQTRTTPSFDPDAILDPSRSPAMQMTRPAFASSNAVCSPRSQMWIVPSKEAEATRSLDPRNVTELTKSS